MSTNDGDIIVRSLTNRAAFAELYDRHERAVFRYATRRLGAGNAEDITSETFLVAFSRRSAFAGIDARPWLLGIATVLMQKHTRLEVRAWRGMRAADLGRIDLDDIAAADDRLDADALASRLGAALAQLSRGERDVLLLHTFGHLDYAEIADALQTPLGTVRSRLSRARSKVRAALEAHIRPAVRRERETSNG